MQKLNQKKRDEMELKRMERKREMEAGNNEEGKHWIFNAEYGEYVWIGEGQPPDEAEPDYRPLTKQQLHAIRQQEEIRLEEMIKEQKNEAIKQRKEKYQERKAALQVPLAPLPEKELCQYERIRENNIKEREKAMADSGFFEDILEYKKKIGLSK